MNYEFINTAFYQNACGELFAVVTLIDENGKEEYRFIPGIERIHYSAESLFDEAKHGFPGHRTIDLIYAGKYIYNYLGLDPEDGCTDINDMIDENLTPCIAKVWNRQFISLDFKHMNLHVNAIFRKVLAAAQAENYEVYQTNT